MKKFWWMGLVGLLLFFSGAVRAENTGGGVNMYVFWSETCPHCQAEKEYLPKLAEKYPELTIYGFEVSKNNDNLALMAKVGQELEILGGGVPLTVVGEKSVLGFGTEETHGMMLEKMVSNCLASPENCPDLVDELNISAEVEVLFAGVVTANDLSVKTEKDETNTGGTSEGSVIPRSVSLPVVGEVQLQHLSLPAVTVVIALLDGFNPCAMWALLFLISLLLGVKDSRRRWIMGGTFILVSGLVYFLILAAWLNVFLVIGWINWVRVGVGLFALVAGGYNLRSYYQNRDGGCEVTGEESRQKVFEKLKKITLEKSLIVALLGISLLAIAVNLVELICSAGLPAIYTQILAMSPMPTWQYYGYLLLYILIFMLDDLAIFLVAMITLKAVGIESKYASYTKLVGGVLMLIIGLLMLFRPEILMFG